MDELVPAPRFRQYLQPKENTGWKRMGPINLKSMALQKVMDVILDPNVEVLDKRTKKWGLDLLKIALPEELHFDLVEHSKRSMLNPKDFIEILGSVPSSVYIKNIDFLGNYRGMNACSNTNYHSWINGVEAACLMDLNVLKKLFDLLDGEDKNKIRILALWTEKHIISSSNFPRILAQCNCLTCLILRGDTDDHVLRIIGLNCHVLKYLDVARSSKITKNGLRNLVCKYLDKNYSALKNAIFDSLTIFVITIGQGNLATEDIICFGKFFSGFLYYIECGLPDYKLTIDKHAVKVPETLHECFGRTNQRLLEDIQALVPFDLANPDEVGMEILKPSPTEYDIKMFNKETRLLRKSVKVEVGLGITELVEYWESQKWNLWELCDITDLGMRTPNLKKLTSRLVGNWDESWGALFPKLEEINSWCVGETSIQAILQHCPSLRYINIRHIPQSQKLLTHESLVEILESNLGMKSSVEKFNIRPTLLSATSVLEIYRQCPKIRRIGDLECWDITNEEIAEINKLMYKENSQCVLVVLDFPPPA